MLKRMKKQTWKQLEHQTGINIAILKAVDSTKKVEKIRGIQI